MEVRLFFKMEQDLKKRKEKKLPEEFDLKATTTKQQPKTTSHLIWSNTYI